MEQTRVERKVQFEHGVLFATFLLLGLGLVMVYSATVYSSTTPDAVRTTGGDGMFYLKKHLWSVGAGLLALVGAAFVPFKLYRTMAKPAMLVGVALMVIVLFLGERKMGAVRWFTVFGVSVQPGEFVKLAFVLWLAHSLTRRTDSIAKFSVGVLPHLLGAIVLVMLYLAQPDLGSTIILGLVMLALLYLAGTRREYIVSMVLIGSMGTATLILTSVERMRRIRAWLNPEAYAMGESYQLVNSTTSIGSGGTFGAGLGSGNQNIAGYVPEAETDFIFSVIGEELGFVGSALVLLAFGYILWRGVMMAWRLRDHFARYVVFGVTLLVVLQAAINVGVTTGVLPTKGLTLPLISMGGSSMVVMCTCLGILLNISRTQPRLVKVRAQHDAEVSQMQVFVREEI